MKIYRGIFSLILFFLIGIGYSQNGSLTPREIAQKAFKSTLLISTEDGTGQPLSLGSGFLIDDKIIVTNYHVVKNSKGGFVKLIGNDKKFRISGFLEINEKYDLAILKIDGIVAQKMTLGDFASLEVGDNVYAVGNPRGLEGTFSQGIVSGIRDYENEKLLQITAPISPGSSGGPVLNSRGEVIGVAVSSITNGQNLNFAIPISKVTEIYQKSTKTLKSFQEIPSTNSTSDSRISPNIKEEVIGTLLTWSENKYQGFYNFTIRNNLDVSIKNILCLVIFYDKDNLPIDIEYVTFNEIIPSRLAKRTNGGRFQADAVRNITSSYIIRILDFEIVK